MAAALGPEVDDDAAQISHFPTAGMVANVAAGDSGGLLARRLTEAGETRPLAALEDLGGWCSYRQHRRVLEALVDVVGGTDQLTQTVLNEATRGEEARVWHSFEVSKHDVFTKAVDYFALFLPILVNELEQVGPTDWVVRSHMVDGYEPFRAQCAWSVGAWAGGSATCGYSAAEAVEVACQCDGAAFCEIRIHWDPNPLEDLQAQVAHLEANLNSSKARFELLSETVGELFSGDGLHDVMPQLVAAASSAVIAPVLLVAVDPGFTHRFVVGEGASQADLDRYGQRLFDGDGLGDKAMVAEIRSSRRHYGHFAALKANAEITGGIDAAALRTYARLAAAALDSAAALWEARHQAATTSALLSLSTSLAGALSLDEACNRVVRTVRELVECEQVALLLFEDGRLRTVASEGLPDAVFEVIQDEQRDRESIEGMLDGPVFMSVETNEFDSARTLRAGGLVASVSIPVVVAGEAIGLLVVGVTHSPERLSATPDLTERMIGLASQGGSAIANARLIEQVRHQALHDSLTGLPNRALILDRTEQMLARARRELFSAGVLFVDLDNFKDINDTLGHAAGDQILQSVAGRLTGALRETDTVGRLGGDEFVVLVEGAAPVVGPEVAAERILAVLSEPFVIPSTSTPILVTASIGMATGDRASAGELLRDADIALYSAKSQGRNRAVVFHNDMKEAIHERRQLDDDLRNALRLEQFYLLYQPTIDLASGTITGAEALIRWRHPTRGIVPPDDFIPATEETGLIIPIGSWVLQEACRQAAEWHGAGHVLSVAVNVSARQLDDDHLRREIEDALATSGLPPQYLTIELTETALMSDAAAAGRCLTAIKATGVRIAIDDFGTGYSSLAYLQQFPVDSLKIDRSFIAAIANGPDASALIHTLIQLGKTLGIETLAEGIEDGYQLAHLQREHCDSGQGYFFARPQSAEDFGQFLCEHRNVFAAP